MFRKMRRFKQQLTEEECKEVLREAKRGVLSMLGDDRLNTRRKPLALAMGIAA